MTKQVIDLNGEIVTVPDEIIVNTLNGVHYLLTLEEEAQRVIDEQNAIAIQDTQDILNKISTLESQITPRRLRDALLGDSSFIDDIELQIQELRTQLGE